MAAGVLAEGVGVGVGDLTTAACLVEDAEGEAATVGDPIAFLEKTVLVKVLVPARDGAFFDPLDTVSKGLESDDEINGFALGVDTFPSRVVCSRRGGCNEAFTSFNIRCSSSICRASKILNTFLLR